tara:strand:- start:1700 stop:2419 length:720 start_codon:yes stop_codon:yes gene_type:complete
MRNGSFLSNTKQHSIEWLRRLRFQRQAKSKNIVEIRNDEYTNNFLFLPTINEKSVVFDIGCAEDADLSQYFITHFQARCFGIDPTRKHFTALSEMEKKYQGKFTHLPYAVSHENSKLFFFESVSNRSGSLKEDHSNVIADTVNKYEVESITIPGLLAKYKIAEVDYLKLDIEGAEYELIERLDSDDLMFVKQLFIEFHHHAIGSVTKNDTEDAVKKIKDLGFECFTYDHSNFLLFKAKT